MDTSWAFESDNLHDWAYWDELFSKEECQKIIAYGTDFEKGTAGNRLIGEVRDSDVFWIYPSEETAWVFQRLTSVITELNTHYFGFDLFGMVEGLQLTKYEAPGGFYGRHIDKFYGSKIRKLSLTVQLSDPLDYEGGDLNLHNSEKPQVMERSLGKLITFPSYVLHEVTPVTKGTRYSLVAWITGKPFK